MSKHSEAVRRWRKAHPEATRRIGRENARKRRRRLGVPERGDRGGYIERKKAVRDSSKKTLWHIEKKIQELELKLLQSRAKLVKMAEIYEAAKKSCKPKMKVAA